MRPIRCPEFRRATLEAALSGDISADEAEARVAKVHKGLAALTAVMEPSDSFAAVRSRMAPAPGAGPAAVPPAMLVRMAAVQLLLDRHFRWPHQRAFGRQSSTPRSDY